MRKIVIATNNAHKADEISHVLGMDGLEFVTMRQAGIESDPAEDADTFEGNARIKALAAHEAGGGVAVMADDSGLVVDALDGAPGVYSSRFAGRGWKRRREQRAAPRAPEGRARRQAHGPVRVHAGVRRRGRNREGGHWRRRGANRPCRAG